MPMIDETALHEFYQGDEDLLADIAELFVENLPKVTKRLKDAIDTHDSVELQEVAHQFKSGLGYFFAEDLNRIALELELRGRERRLDGCEQLSEALFYGLHQLLQELSNHTKNRYEIAF